MGRAFRQPPAGTRQRGLPAIGFDVDIPDGLEVTQGTSGDGILHVVERRADGALVGELDIRIVPAALIIDRDGVLEDKARELAEVSPAIEVEQTVSVEVPGASGFRADGHARGIDRGPLPYVHAFAVAPDDLGVAGCLTITVRSARTDWPAGEVVMQSLRVIDKLGKVPEATNKVAALLPVVSGRGKSVDDSGD